MHRLTSLAVAIAVVVLAGPGLAQTEFSIAKVDTPDPVNAGNLLTYTMTGTNVGPGGALDLTIADPLPTGTVFISAVASPGATLTTPAVGANGTVTSIWNAAGGTPGGVTDAGVPRTLTAVVRVCPEFGCNELSDTATISGGGGLSVNGVAETTVDVVGDLAITKDGPTEAKRNDALTYTLTVQNTGPSSLTGVEVTDTLPPDVVATDVSTTITGATCAIAPDEASVTCTFDLGAANQCATTQPTSGTITIEALVLPSAQAGDYENLAEIATGTCGTDSDPSDNSDTLPLRIFTADPAPAMGTVGMAALAALLAGAGVARLRRRR